MQHREHLLAVVVPNEAGEAPLDLAAELVARGGKATVVVLLTEQVRDDFRRFADAEDLDLPTGEAIALDRLIEAYNARIGGDDTETFAAGSSSSARDLLHTAAVSGATTIAIPQQLAARSNLRGLMSDAHVPVLIAPAA